MRGIAGHSQEFDVISTWSAGKIGQRPHDLVTWWGAYGTIFGEMALQNDKDRAATIESGSQRWNMVKPEEIPGETLMKISMENVWNM